MAPPRLNQSIVLLGHYWIMQWLGYAHYRRALCQFVASAGSRIYPDREGLGTLLAPGAFLICSLQPLIDENPAFAVIIGQGPVGLLSALILSHAFNDTDKIIRLFDSRSQSE